MSSLRLYEHHPNWDRALDVLRSVLPDATGFDADLLPSPEASRFELDGRSEVDIALDLVLRADEFIGELVVVNDGSYQPTNTGPLFVEGPRLLEVIERYPEQFDSCFFNGDVWIVEPARNRIVVVHHSEVLLEVRGHD